MPPIWYGADRPIRVTRPLQHGVAGAAWFHLESNLPEEYQSEAEAVTRFVQSRRLTIDADTFSVVRNILDINLINDGCQHEHDPAFDRHGCDWCEWCQTMVLRDWMDALMDRAGCRRSPRVEAYVSQGDGDPAREAARYEASSCGCHDDCRMLCGVRGGDK